MTLRCYDCGSLDLILVDDNGAEYPETRIEDYECGDCGNEQRTVLVA
jgi:ribosomal protein S27E